MVGIPDTQHYAQDYPDTFHAMTEWVAGLGPDLVVQVGDVVDEDYPEQWAVADSAFRALDDAGVPYVLAAGNHDYTYDGRRDSMMSGVFPAARLGLDGAYEDGRSENGWRLVDLGGEEWMVLSLELFPREAVVAWAEGVLAGHPATPTIIVTHAYLNTDGLRYGEDQSVRHPYGAGDLPGSTGRCGRACANDAETLHRRLVQPFPQVALVLSGHVLSGPAHRTDYRPDGTPAHQVVQNYQEQAEGGNGYLRVYEARDGVVTAATYSPVTGEWLTGEPHGFELWLGRNQLTTGG
jgi:3',5'-cyclic AMP phosphodiesterase CpdA